MEHYLDILTHLLRLRQICDQPLLVALSTLEQEKHIEALRRRSRRSAHRRWGKTRFSYLQAHEKVKAAYAQVWSDNATGQPTESGNTSLLSRLMGVTELCRLCFDDIGPGSKVELPCRHTFCRSVCDSPVLSLLVVDCRPLVLVCSASVTGRLSTKTLSSVLNAKQQ